MKLLLVYLSNAKRHYTFSHFVQLLDKSKNKKDFKLLILIDSDGMDFYYEELKKVDIQHQIQLFCYADNYIWKLRYANDIATESNIPYMMKCDNDVFLTADTFDFMFDNLDKLNDKHLTIGPVLSSGIPTVEYFLEQYMDPSSADIVRQKFLQTTFFDRDHTCYKQLNAHTIYANNWDKKLFFENLKNTVYPLRGIHPIRINNDAIHFVNQYILDNKQKFYDNNPKDIIYDDNSPYLCNTLFCIRTDVYKKILFDNSLFQDSYDEVPLNKYAWNNNMNHLFIKNGFGIHMLYNWNEEYLKYEEIFCEKFFNNNTDDNKFFSNSNEITTTIEGDPDFINVLTGQLSLFKNDSVQYLDELLKIVSSNKSGIEIGGTSPPGLRIYENAASMDNVNFAFNTTWSDNTNIYNYFQDKVGKTFIADATDLSIINDSKYDFLFACHVFEHIANPLKAFKEFLRVTDDKGFIVFVLPDKNRCFDNKRKFTEFSTILSQYEKNVEENDLFSLPEILANHDMALDTPAGTFEDFIRRSLNNFDNRCLHHFVYSEKLVRDICDFFKCKFVHTLSNGLDMWFIIQKL